MKAILPREKELFYGARAIGWTLMIFSILLILGVGIVSIWDSFRSGFGPRGLDLYAVLTGGCL